jgi:hypothetical protein
MDEMASTKLFWEDWFLRTKDDPVQMVAELQYIAEKIDHVSPRYKEILEEAFQKGLAALPNERLRGMVTRIREHAGKAPKHPSQPKPRLPSPTKYAKCNAEVPAPDDSKVGNAWVATDTASYTPPGILGAPGTGSTTYYYRTGLTVEWLVCSYATNASGSRTTTNWRVLVCWP